MQTDFLILGQGLSGTWLSYYLMKEGKSCFVFDEPAPLTASRVSGGIINPVTGRRHAKVWMVDEIMDFVYGAYQEIGKEFNQPVISRKSIIDFFPSPDIQISFEKRVAEKNPFMHMYPEREKYRTDFEYPFGWGEITPAYSVLLENLLPAWRQVLSGSGCLSEEILDISKLVIEQDQVRYGDITAKKIIFCNGDQAATQSWFRNLPFAPNKGQILLLDIPGLSQEYIYKKSITLVPLGKPGQWWAGSSYEWEFEGTGPTDEFRTKTIEQLNGWLKHPYTVTGHFASTRPATLERRPFVGLHPLFPSVGILNGMGTKGCSLAPFFAHQFIRHLLYQEPIAPDADVKRFTRLLSR